MNSESIVVSPTYKLADDRLGEIINLRDKFLTQSLSLEAMSAVQQFVNFCLAELQPAPPTLGIQVSDSMVVTDRMA